MLVSYFLFVMYATIDCSIGTSPHPGETGQKHSLYYKLIVILK